MKKQIFKSLLFLVRFLVLTKRAIVWGAKSLGKASLWIAKPAVPFLLVPGYNLARRVGRQYQSLSESKSERRMRLIFSEPVLLFVTLVLTLLISRAAAAAAQTSGTIAGGSSILFTQILSKGESDWQADETGTNNDVATTEPAPTIVFQGDGTVARVFPYGGIVGKAPSTEPVTPEKKETPPFQKYAVQRGDTIAKIAKKFHVTQETVLAANSLMRSAAVRAGDTLTIPTQDGILYSVRTGGKPQDVARKFGVQLKTITLANNIVAATILTKGQLLLIPGVKPVVPAEPQKVAVAPKPSAAPVPEEQPAPVADEAPPATEEVPPNLPSDVTPINEPAQPSTAEVTPHPPLAAGEKLLWPTVRHVITQYFSAGHPGIDIDGDYDNQIYAAADGTVVSSGWNDSGYGNMILIDHGNGMQTRYGHGSRVFVSVGQQVHRGDVIGMVGTTGRSTGTHLHFEVIIGGRRVSPLKYVR